MKILLIFSLFNLQMLSAYVQADSLNNEGSFSVQHIRSATVKVTYGDKTLLIDPILAEKGSDAPIMFSNDTRNPTIGLPFSKETILEGVDAVLLTHYHSDHFDSEAEHFLPKDLLIFCQPGDAGKLRDKGFKNVKAIDSVVTWDAITISRFKISHYKGANGELPFGESSSYCLTAKNETLFITGDAILDERLKSALLTTNPQIIIANTGECQFTQINPVLKPGVTMTLTSIELEAITKLLPDTKIIAVHMDAINHCSLTKADLRAFIAERKLLNLYVPNEGESLINIRSH